MVTAYERLLPLVAEINKDHINDYVNFLTQMRTPEDMGRVMHDSGKPWEQVIINCLVQS
jgi:hypothetical protein